MSGSSITSSIIMERIIGLSVLSFLSVFSIFFIDDELLSGFKYFILLVPLLIIAINLTLYFSNNTIIKFLPIKFLQDIILEITNYWKKFLNNYKVFIKIIIITLFSHFCVFWVIYYLFLTFNYNLSFLLVLYVMPIVFIMSSIPVSIAGRGMREVGSFLLFQIPAEISTAVGITFGLMQIIFALPGGFIFLFLKKNKLRD